MPRYFMHLRHPVDELIDSDGIMMPQDAVARAALNVARDCMSHDVRGGRLDLAYMIEVQNEAGEVTHTLQFADALNIP